MGWFFKKNTPPEPPPCKHKYQDFPWYVESTYYMNSNTWVARIFEPYVCVHCKHRKNVLLQELTRIGDLEKTDKWLADLMTEYSEHIQPRPIVEDMIADMQLVDRQWLETMMFLKSGLNVPTLSIPKENQKDE